MRSHSLECVCPILVVTLVHEGSPADSGTRSRLFRARFVPRFEAVAVVDAFVQPLETFNLLILGSQSLTLIVKLS